jgi:transposase
MMQVAMSDQEIVRRHRTIWAATALGPWLADCLASEMPKLLNLANGLQRERSAVQNALILPYSNGQVEGQITKLKLRSGRAMATQSWICSISGCCTLPDASIPKYESCGRANFRDALQWSI